MATFQNQIRKKLSRRFDLTLDEDPDLRNSSKKTTERDRKRQERNDAIHALKEKLKKIDTMAAILSMLGLIIAIIEYERYYSDNGKKHFTVDSQGNILRAVVCVMTVILVIFLYQHSRLHFAINQKKATIIEKDDKRKNSYWRSSEFWGFLLEVVINGVVTPPTVESNFEVTQSGHTFIYSVDGFITNWMLLRAYLVFRLFALYSKWTSRSAEECCEPEGCEANTVFAIKAVLKDKPYATLLIIMVASTIIFGLAIRNFESPFYYGMASDNGLFQDYSFIWNGMWLIAVTMTTVGYGDYYPRTVFGRLIAVVSCFWGVFLVSMMVVTLTVSSSFETKEAKAYDILFRLNVKQSLKKRAGRVVLLCLQSFRNQMQFDRGQIPETHMQKTKDRLTNQLEIRLEEFKNEKALLTEYEVPAEELLRQLTEKVDRDFDEIKELLLSLVEMDKQVIKMQDLSKAVMGAINECSTFTNSLQEQLLKLKESF